MDYFSATIYGLVQGLTEFLPISSSAHLALLPGFLHIEDPGVGFDLMMHLGTALSLLVYFRRKILHHLKVFFPSWWNIKTQRGDFFLIRNLTLSVFATVVFIFIFKDIAEMWGRSLPFIYTNLLFFGVFLWLADKYAPHKEQVMSHKFNGIKSLSIGLAQALAIFPGVSRSGMTITAARLSSLKKEEALEYSFLLSLPIILAAAVYQIPKSLQTGFPDLGICLWAIFVSFLAGYLTVHFFMKWVAKTPFFIFMLYRIGLALFLYFTH